MYCFIEIFIYCFQVRLTVSALTRLLVTHLDAEQLTLVATHLVSEAKAAYDTGGPLAEKAYLGPAWTIVVVCSQVRCTAVRLTTAQ